MTRVLMVGGTSAGHLAPMIAVAEALEKLEPNAHVLFVCSDKPSDAAFLSMEGRSCLTLPLPRTSLVLPFTLLRGFSRSLRILKDDRTDVVFSKGSAVSIPLCLAARVRGIPVVLHESDSVMGRANRFISLFATKTLLGTDVGNPIRSRVTAGKKEDGLRITGFSGQKPVLLVMGGSQGARAINDCVTTNLDAILRTFDVIHLTGAGKNTTPNKPGYHATEFGSDVLPHLYAITTLAVCRAGAGSFAELTACGIPAVLVPIKGLAHDHQVKNAAAYEATGAVMVLPQERLDKIPSLIASLLKDSSAMQTMRDACRYAARPEAARLIAETVVLSVAR